MSATVSVIIPIKNRAHLIGETLDSIVNQTLKPLEIIIVDDHSTDDLNKSISKYQKIIDIKIIKSPSNGPGAARNAGIKEANGKFVQFFDSDDIMTKNKLSEQVKTLNESGNHIVIGPYVPAIKTESGWQQVDVILQYFPYKKYPLDEMVLQGWCAPTQSSLFSKELIKEAGFWREDLMPHEDKEYWYRLGRINEWPEFENMSCVIYRQHGSQITDLQTKNESRSLDGINALHEIKKQMKKKYRMYSKLVFNGHIKMAEYNVTKKNKEKLPNIDFNSVCLRNIYRVVYKLGRIRTGTNWQPMHGVLNSMEQFKKYMEQL